ncbi:hypothetical protein WH47_07474 [Habropoda laboriosa]|uniref:Uncharacterized protein n=1 Tax=Habropoda laboriosa TaxID=597456 RepID=A0A0L7QPR1_9HYME|nr:hypothetical protein WH47_07474 [Habropoda laboriosa]
MIARKIEQMVRSNGGSSHFQIVERSVSWHEAKCLANGQETGEVEPGGSSSLLPDIATPKSEFFNSQNNYFYKFGIVKVINRWEKCIESCGNYVD